MKFYPRFWKFLVVMVWLGIGVGVGFRFRSFFSAEVGKFTQAVATVVKLTALVPLTTLTARETLTPEEVIEAVNQWRTAQNLAGLKWDKVLCSSIESGETVFQLDESSLELVCPSCERLMVLTAGNVLFPRLVLWQWEKDEATQKLVAEDFTHTCPLLGERLVAIELIKVRSVMASPLPKATQPVGSIKNFSEQELWQALVNYRQAHQKPDLLFSEWLCSYGRGRLEEQIQMFTTTAKEEYPNQDKYPLDAHAGFQRDGESGYLFERTGFNVVAENLAYWPSASYPHQVIEWGWDTSTEGHRETQLSTDYTHACITGREGFFVALFGRN
ncbi:hypothetical protein A3A66_03755 [Microgenomates group bacterium RIFCSPLOWO2_01_FULL_46_13]|nr:MAG: hypothetical protein A2783_00445 [Microgenomates group bacterium RIFCSPHIGHO2_01_FULL_45_11]OGV95179.1 MAG: hypothetical protein A3A66_03755 [Microgenomates group bacterium RIFCSPLOWO2_01_FULL_46_13]